VSNAKNVGTEAATQRATLGTDKHEFELKTEARRMQRNRPYKELKRGIGEIPF